MESIIFGVFLSLLGLWSVIINAKSYLLETRLIDPTWNIEPNDAIEGNPSFTSKRCLLENFEIQRLAFVTTYCNDLENFPFWYWIYVNTFTMKHNFPHHFFGSHFFPCQTWSSFWWFTGSWSEISRPTWFGPTFTRVGYSNLKNCQEELGSL